MGLRRCHARHAGPHPGSGQRQTQPQFPGGPALLYWMGVEVPPDFLDILRARHRQAKAGGYRWVAMESAELLATLDNEQEEAKQAAEGLSQTLQCRFLTHIIAPQTTWKKSLQELIDISARLREPQQMTRLCWMVEYVDGILGVAPARAETLPAAGPRGAPSPFKRRCCLRPGISHRSDRHICAALQQTGTSSKNGGYIFQQDISLPALVGHPYVFLKRSPQTQGDRRR